MDSTVGFYPTNVGSIPAGQTNGDYSVKVNTTDCDSVNMGSIPISYPSNTPVVEW